jgi:hypothetical protein
METWAMDVEKYSEVPIATKLVANRGRMVKADGERYATYRSENYQWRDALCTSDANGRPVGKDPMTIPLEILTRSGHGRDRVNSVVYRLKIMQGVATGEMQGELSFKKPTRLTNIRDYCMGCSNDNKAEVRRCGIYDCPAWPYRMGRNPHNPRRGVNPFPKENANGSSG